VPYGTYNLSNSGEAKSWYEVARDIYRLQGADPILVKPISTADYAKPNTAPRPPSSVLDLSRIRATGFDPPDATERLAEYLRHVHPQMPS